MQPSDWEALRSLWRSRPREWQLRCADMVSAMDLGTDADPAIPILLEMIQSSDDELTFAAADSLRCLGSGKIDLDPEVKPHILHHLQELIQRQPGLTARALNELRTRLQSKDFEEG